MTSSPDILGPWVGGKVVCPSREQESRDPRQPIGRRFDNQLVNQSLLVTSSVSVSPGWSVHAGSRCSALHCAPMGPGACLSFPEDLGEGQASSLDGNRAEARRYQRSGRAGGERETPGSPRPAVSPLSQGASRNSRR